MSSLNRAKTLKKRIRERRRKLTEQHYHIIDWLMCIDDNIVLGDDAETTEFIKLLNSYTERLAILLGERQQRRLSKEHNHKVRSDETRQ